VEPLEGRIVRLEPLGPEHEGPLAEAAADDVIWRWFPLAQPRGREDNQTWIHFLRGRPDARPFATLVGGVPLGSTSYLNVRKPERVVEIGATWLSPRAWNTGANAESKYLLMRHAFETLGYARVEFKTDARNERARRALEALPAQFEGIHRSHLLVRLDERRDSAWYSVLDHEWPQVKANLEERLRAHR
jgi:RimJ/RimL family protein N-acetyltransferase